MEGMGNSGKSRSAPELFWSAINASFTGLASILALKTKTQQTAAQQIKVMMEVGRVE
jgi:hypothetical protein